MSETESASAALRRVEQERDGVVRYAATIGPELARLRELMRIQARVVVEKNAELASARQELDAVRTARDNLDRELAEARATIRALTRTPEGKP